jgi:hypothetical protein
LYRPGIIDVFGAFKRGLIIIKNRIKYDENMHKGIAKVNTSGIMKMEMMNEVILMMFDVNVSFTLRDVDAKDKEELQNKILNILGNMEYYKDNIKIESIREDNGM